MRYRAVIADDHQLMAEGLRRILEPEYEVAATAADGHELVRLAAELRPEIVLADITMPLLNGVDATRQIKSLNKRTVVVIVTMHTEPEFAVEAFDAGASAYVLKRVAGEELLTAIRMALAGKRYTSSFPGSSAALENRELRKPQLTARQREILQLVAEGKSAKEIAAILNISVKTVAFHKTALFDALGLRTTAELTQFAVKSGLI